ncbi:MAG: PKD domain-containing protein [Sphingobacteriales bacterium]|nr:PKD domain-containing protein [Sphingobacteriales bacterium]
MKKLNKTLLIICLGLGIIYGSKADANNILGGEITWNQVGKDTFMITLTLYRDCNGNAFGNQQVLVKCQSTGITLDTLIFSAVSGVDITPVCKTSCSRCDSSSCSFIYGIQKYEYKQMLIIQNAGSCCKILLAYSQCCRPSTITTGPASTNFYIDSWFNRCLDKPDNSPVFMNAPVHILCIGLDFQWAPGINENDRDSVSLSYSYNNGPRINSTTKVTYISPYTYEKFIYFWGFPNTSLPFPRGFDLDLKTGEYGFRTMKLEQTVTAYNVEQWRKINGNYEQISSTTRETHFFVVKCPSNVSYLGLSGPKYKEVCEGDTVIFSIGSIDYTYKDSLKIYYNGEIEDALWSDNNGFTKIPTGNFKWGTKIGDASRLPYYFTGTAKSSSCDLLTSTTRVYQIIVKKKPSPPAFHDTLLYCNEIKLEAITPLPYHTYYWEIGDNPSVKLSGSKISYLTPKSGHIPVSLYSLYNGCKSDIIRDTVSIDTFMMLNKLTNDTICINDSLIVRANVKYNKGKVSYQWSTQDSLQQIMIKPGQTTTYKLTVVDSFGCRSIDSFIVSVKPLPDLMPHPDFSICSGDSVWLSALSAGNGSFDLDVIPCFYKLPDPNPLQCGYFHMQRKDSGDYVIKVTSKYGCVALDTFKLSLYPEVKAFAADTTLCPNETIILQADSTGSKSDSTIYLWYDYLTGDLIGNGQSITAKADINKVFRLYAAEWFNDRYCKDSSLVTLNRKNTLIDPRFPESFCINDSFTDLRIFIKHGKGLLYALHNSVIDSYYYNPAISNMFNDSIQITFTDFSTACTYDSLLIFSKKEIPAVYISNQYFKSSFCPEYGKIKLYGNPFSPKYSKWYGPVDDSSFFDANTSTGIYTLVYEYKANNGCLNRDTLIISIGKTAISIDKSDTAICSGKHFSAKANVAFAQKMQWIYGLGSDGFMNGSIYNVQNTYVPGAGEKLKRGFMLYAKTIDPVCPETWDSIKVYIAAQPKADFSADMLTGNTPLNVQFRDQTNIAYDYISDYLWNFGDGDTSSAINPLHLYADTGHYSVSLKVVSDYGCADSLTKNNLIYVYPVAIPELVKTNFKVYPNPSHDKIFIESEIGLQKISLYNITGKIIFESDETGSHTAELTGLHLSDGLYLLKITDLENNTGIFHLGFQ